MNFIVRTPRPAHPRPWRGDELRRRLASRGRGRSADHREAYDDTSLVRVANDITHDADATPGRPAMTTGLPTVMIL